METIEQQTGWERPWPKMICQDHKVLLKITEFSYDLSSDEFVGYFMARTGQLITCCDAGTAMQNVLAPDSDTTDIVDRITKAKLQDCWELFLAIPAIDRKRYEVIRVDGRYRIVEC